MIQRWQIKEWAVAHKWTTAIAVFVFLMVIVGGLNWLAGWRYDKERLKYEADSKSWATEKAKLLGQVAERDRRIEQLEAKEAAIIAADQAGKKIDDALAQKIDDATKAAAADAAVTDLPADCVVRAERTCAKLAGLRPPITIDCAEYKRRICPR